MPETGNIFSCGCGKGDSSSNIPSGTTINTATTVTPRDNGGTSSIPGAGISTNVNTGGESSSSNKPRSSGGPQSFW